MIDELDSLRASLLRGLRVELGPEDGDLAFERHILLTVRFHRAAGLNQTVPGEGKGWEEFFRDHFPKRATWRDSDAETLWTNWRLGLVKHETPFPLVTLAHGQPHAHWHREPNGAICINLESMWDDFEASVSSFVALLASEPPRAREAIRRWRERTWTVRPLQTDVVMWNTAASVSTSPTAIAGTLWPR